MSISSASQGQSRNQSPLPGRQRRPFVLKALIVLLILQAVVSIVVMLSLLFAYPRILAQSSIQLEPMNSPFINLISSAILVTARLLIAIGLWRLRRWAWVWMMVQLAGSMAMDIQTYYTGQPLYLSMLLNVIVVFYLNQHEVQDLFITPEEKESP